AIPQDAGVTVDVGDGALGGCGVDEAVIEGGVSGLGQQRAECNPVRSLGGVDDLQVNLAPRVLQSCGFVGVGHENPFALWLIWLPLTRCLYVKVVGIATARPPGVGSADPRSSVGAN